MLAKELPSPCGEWGAARKKEASEQAVTDPLRGVDCSWKMGHEQRYAEVTDPLRGVDCSRRYVPKSKNTGGYRPLAGSGLQLPTSTARALAQLVTDPLRGVDCSMMVQISLLPCLLPTPCGEWIAASNDDEILSFKVTDPLRGVDCSHAMERTGWLFRLPTPCGE